MTAVAAIESGDGAGAPAPADVSPARLLAVLGLGGAVAGVLLVVVFFLTLPAIEANRARDLQMAVAEVLKGPERYDTLYVVDGALVKQVPAGADARQLEQVYLGYGPGNRPLGFALVAEEPGFQDLVRLIVGYDARAKRVLGIMVLESKETPGLGDKIQKDTAFIDQFAGAEPPLVGARSGKRSAPREVDMITGATISSRAVIRIINNAVRRFGPMLDAYARENPG